MLKLFLGILFLIPSALLAEKVKPIDECTYTWTDMKLDPAKACADTFEAECLEKNGVVTKVPMHPQTYGIKYCYPKSFDAGAPCGQDSDCMIECDFEYAISHNCSLEKEVKLEGENISEKTFNCTDKNPGICLPAPVVTPMNGVTIEYKMNGKKLIKTVTPGPIG